MWRGWNRLRINAKFSLAILLVTLAFLGSVYLVSRSMLKRFSLETAEEVANIRLDSTESRIIDFFDEMQALGQSLSRTYAVQSLDPEGMRDLFIASLLPRKKYLRAIYLGTEDGRMFEWGVGPEFVDYSPTSPPAYDPRTRPWYKTALNKRGFAVTEPYRYASVDVEGITCVLPVWNREGNLIGVLGFDILQDSLKALLEELNIPKDGKALLISAGGRFIAGTLNPNLIPSLQKESFEAEGRFRIQNEGQEILISHRLNRLLGWHLLIALPYSQILFHARWLLALITFINLLLMGLLIIIISIVANRIITSQQEITRYRILEERKRIYRDMHDSIGAKLTNIFFCAQVARKVAEQDGIDVINRIQELVEDVEKNSLEAMKHVKNILRGLDEGETLDKDFGACISAAIRKRLEMKKIEFHCRIDPPHLLSSIPIPVQNELEKVFEELVSNVLKHSAASTVGLDVLEKHHTLNFCFRDDGTGFSSIEERVNIGNGIHNIRFRIESLKGNLSIESEPGKGTRFTFNLPSIIMRENEEFL